MGDDVSLATRVLCCIMGSIRGGPLAWQSLELRVLRPLNADLAVLGEQVRPSQAPLYKLARYVWPAPEPSDWGTLVTELTGSEAWRAQAAQHPSDGLRGGVVLTGGRPLNGSGAVIFSLRLVLLRQLERLFADPSAPQYGQVIVTRSDHFYACEHPRLPAAHVWVPSGEGFGGVTDRHVAMPPRLARAVLSPLPWLADGRCAPQCASLLSPEWALAAYWKAQSIKWRNSVRNMFTVIAQDDTTRWVGGSGIGLGDKLPGLQVKYVTEFFRTTCSCPRANCVFARPNSTMSCSAPPNTEPAADRHAAACERNMKHPGKNGAVGRAIRRHANSSH